eukprot:TRINITY_DN89_c0_g1_i6.p1 TRINITY_DN89_c0_g1~~TRINITY_DN89_c0_g1_i6.p1  ORF type:complete len:519 (+),score=196.79 TRINITY_DN89_c0_g1_i6:33-1559(+)
MGDHLSLLWLPHTMKREAAGFCGCASNRAIAILSIVACCIGVWAFTKKPYTHYETSFEVDRTDYTVTNFQAWSNAIPLIGKHWIVEFEGCDGGIINDEQLMLKITRDAVNAANASLVTIISKAFDHMGVTILALLSESHIGIHTWPQYGYVATDVFTCGHIAQPQVAVEYMSKAFKANESATRYVYLQRGGHVPSSDLRTIEESNDKKELVAYIKTPFHKAHIFWTEINGLHFLVDSVTQSVEADERVYHESLVHPAMLAHPHPKEVLIIGGAEGAVLREVLAHNTVERATMVELDGEIVNMCKQFMPTWSEGAFDDRRANLIIDDGKIYLEQKVVDGTLDVLIVDGMDPKVGLSTNNALYSDLFFQLVAKKLGPNGVYVMQAGQMDEDEDENVASFAHLLHRLHVHFPFVTYYTKYVRSADGFRSFILACHDHRCNEAASVNPNAPHSAVDKLIAERIVNTHSLQSYDGESNRGMLSVNRETRDSLASLEHRRMNNRWKKQPKHLNH